MRSLGSRKGNAASFRSEGFSGKQFVGSEGEAA